MAQDLPDAVDPLLAPLLSASDEAQVEQYIGKLLVEHAPHIIRNVVNKTVFRLGGGGASGTNVQDIQEAEDLVSQVQLRLVHTLRHLASRKNNTPIRNFSAYVVGVSQNVCNSFLREKWPERYRLKNRASYVLSNDARFTIWEDSRAGRMCGLAEWKSNGTPLAPERRLEELRSLSLLPAASPDPSGSEVAGLLIALLDRAGAPVRIDDLVGIVATRLGISDHATDRQFEAARDGQWGAGPGIAAEQPEVEERLRLKSMWSDMVRLSHSQKLALLLGLKDEHGDSLLRFLSAENIVTMREITTALEITAAELAGIWGDLPLNDARIGAMLGVERKRIPTLRQGARRRLAGKIER